MFSKGTKIYSMLTGKCPRCHEENMYVNNNPYILNQTMKMHDHCSNCGFKYELEPNFFFGAMFISYALAVMAGILIFLVAHFIVACRLRDTFIAICTGLILLMPITIRHSRNIYINIFVSYDKNAGSKQAKVKHASV